MQEAPYLSSFLWNPKVSHTFSAFRLLGPQKNHPPLFFPLKYYFLTQAFLLIILKISFHFLFILCVCHFREVSYNLYTRKFTL